MGFFSINWGGKKSTAKIVSLDKKGVTKVKVANHCQYCNNSITPSTRNVCKYCRKTFCDEHINTFAHNCKKRESGYAGGMRPTSDTLRYSK